MKTAHSWITVGLVAVLVGMADRPAQAEGLATEAIVPLRPRYLPQTLTPAPADRSRIQSAVRHAQVAIPGPVTHVKGSHASLRAWMWAGVVVGALVVVAVLTIPRD